MRLASGKILFFVLLFLPGEMILTQSVPQTLDSPNFVSAEMSVHEFARRLAPWLSRHPELATKVIAGQQIVAKSQVPHDQQVNMIYRMTFPTLDIYSSAGVPLYFSDYAEASVKVIDALPQVIPEANLNPRYKVRPSLRETLSMVPAIPNSGSGTTAQFDYTIFTVVMDHTGDTRLQSKNAIAHQSTNKVIHLQNIDGSGPSIRAVEAPASPVSPEDAQKNALAKEANALANQAQDQAIQRLKTRLERSRIRVIEVHLTQQ